jgi:tRNA 2-thiocytidine biosynthesis protein TtcA
MDSRLFDFSGLRAEGRPDTDGDIAFDEPPCSGEEEAAADVIRFA